jgi:calpain-15
MPTLVERLFLTKDYNEEGVYHVKICKNGEWVEVAIDDYFPCFPNGAPIFSKGHGNELWVLILEKAYAKLHGNYKSIVGGMPHEAMMDLTGCPTTTFSFKDQNVQDMIRSGKLWALMKQYDKEGYIMSGGTPGEDTMTENQDSNQQKGGLIPGHAYSVISAMEYKGVKLLKIRNPWGQFEWDGDWSDHSSLWTDEMK